MKPVVRSLSLPALVVSLLAIPMDGAAQGRAVSRPSTGATGHAVARPVYHQTYYRPYYRPYYYGSYYRPYYYGPGFGFGYAYGGWYGGFGLGIGWGWPGWYGSGWYGYGYPYAYGPYPYGGYPYGYYDNRGAARLEVRPREAQVFIDGYFVGAVDDFDGWAQRLYVAPGEHELAIYLQGHRTYRQSVLFRPGATLRLEHVLQPLAPGDPEESRPEPDRTAPRGQSRPDPRDYPPARDYPPPQDYPRQPGDPVPAPRRGADEPPPGRSDQYGSLAVRVQPFDAEVFVDGESWQSPEAGSITLQLSEGVHRVEVRKQGYRTYSAEVRVRRGDSTAVNVSLSRN